MVAAGLVATAAQALAGTPAGGAALKVTPSHGQPSTTFVVRFTAPSKSGIAGGQRSAYSLTVQPVHPQPGCVQRVVLSPTVEAARQTVAVRLRPHQWGPVWCPGLYSGRILETVEPDCGPVAGGMQAACPQYIMIRPIGTFSFRVSG